MKAIYECGSKSCPGWMLYTFDIEEYDFDTQGNLQRDSDDLPIIVQYAVFECDTCGRKKRKYRGIVGDRQEPIE